MPKAHRVHLTTNEENILEGANSTIAELRAELHAERLAHELTRGDLLIERRKRETLEEVLHLLEDDEPPTSPEIPAAIRAALPP